MSEEGRTWRRGAVSLVILGGLVAAMLMSPVGAAPKPATKKFVKKQVQAVRTDLGGQIQVIEDSTMWAKVDADAGSATLIQGHGVASVADASGVGAFRVTFVRAITGCAWVATLNDNGSGVAPDGEISVEQLLATAPESLLVRTHDSAGVDEDPAADDGFSVAVFC